METEATSLPLVAMTTEEQKPLVTSNGTDKTPQIMPASPAAATQNNNILSSKMEDGPLAISFRGAYKSYGRKVPVLVNLDMSIPRGAIYGLLGPSGCGKTTLLQCIVGKQRLQAGSVTVFGGPPGSKRAGVPGPRVGYMPQELAMYYEFTIAETLSYFGHIFGMSSSRIRERTEFLMEFLDLPRQKNRLIRELSGGQQRRASLAAALLHEPELLILDEPTVGVDPLLRQCIWDHLLEISRHHEKVSTTIVITTHYIEEARQAHAVGMMRFGRLLAEDSPGNLLEQYDKPTLESVFLHLCVSDDSDRGSEEDVLVVEAKEKLTGAGSEVSSNGDLRRRSSCNTNGHLPHNKHRNSSQGHVEHLPAEVDDLTTVTSHSKKAKDSYECPTSTKCDWVTFHRLRALLVKNFIRMWRNLGFLTFQFIIPTVQVALFCLAIGRDPAGLTMAVVNGDDPTGQCAHFTRGCILGNKDSFMETYDYDTSHKANMSCRFMSYINEEFVRPVFFDNVDEALRSVRLGKHWGVMEFRSNYSEALYDRMFGMAELRTPSNETLDTSDIHIHLDMTNQQVGYTIQLRLGDAYQTFARDLLAACDIPNRLAALPIVFEEPVYGSNEPTFTEFMAPGVILSITYFMAVGLTALSFIIERKEGLLERSWVAGVTATEVMLAHVVAQFAVMVVQVSLVLIFMIFVFAVPAHGPMVWVVCLTLLQGLCGMAFGLVVSALCDNEQDAIQLALGSFYPNLLLSGIIWPLEGMPPELRYISYILPQTYACEAMRGILSRGWGLAWPQVYIGYLVTIVWTVIQLVLSAFILRVRR